MSDRSSTVSRRAALASVAGTTIEYYDFFLYGAAAALVFGPQFFPSISPVAGALASFGVFAAGFLARPLGGLVMGHFGDRLGRKSMLVLSLLMVGGTTFAIGLLPTYASIGVWAPILLVLLRVIQGFGVGGEWSGAVLISVEHAPPGRRSLYGVFPQMGVPLGLLLANLAFLGAAAHPAFSEWAWRIPFLASAVLILVGLLVRTAVTESPAFTSEQKRSERPLVEVIREFPRSVLISAGLPIAPIMITYIVTTFSLSYLTSNLGVARPIAIASALVTTAVFAAVLPVAGIICDKTNPLRVLMVGCFLLLSTAAAYFPLVDTRQTAAVMLAGVGVGLGLGATYGPVATLISDLFPTRVRFSGSSLGYQIATLVGGAPAPFVAVALTQATGSSIGVTLYMGVAVLVSMLCTALLLATARRAAAPTSTTTEAEPVG